MKPPFVACAIVGAVVAWNATASVLPTGHIDGYALLSVNAAGTLTLSGAVTYYEDVLVPTAVYEFHGRNSIANSMESAVQDWSTPLPAYRIGLQFPASPNRCYSGTISSTMDLVGYEGLPVPRLQIATRDDSSGVACYYPPPPVLLPPPDPDGGGQVATDGWWCGGWCDPLVLDLNGDGIHTTGLNDLVSFDLDGNGTRDLLTWTDSSTMEGFLWLNLNHRNRVDDGRELFGIGTRLPDGTTASDGFQALRMYDQPSQGGNGDGMIDHRDTVWPHLHVWIDANHDGVSEPDEIAPVARYGIESIPVTAEPSAFVDAAGTPHPLHARYRRRHGQETATFDIDALALRGRLR